MEQTDTCDYFSRSFIGPSQAFTVSFLSTYSVVNVPYTISGIVTGDITNAALSGNLNGYNNTLSYVSSATSRKTFTFTAGGVTKSVSFLSALYTVTVAGGVFYISTNGGTSIEQPSLTFASGGLYVFDQSDATNVGNRLVLGTGPDTGRSDTNVVFNETPGSVNAYTLLDLSGVATTDLYYFSATTIGMGRQPPALFITGISPILTQTYSITEVNGALTIRVVDRKTLYYVLVGGGGSTSRTNPNANGYVAGGGGMTSGSLFLTAGTYAFSSSVGGANVGTSLSCPSISFVSNANSGSNVASGTTSKGLPVLTGVSETGASGTGYTLTIQSKTYNLCGNGQYNNINSFLPEYSYTAYGGGRSTNYGGGVGQNGKGGGGATLKDAYNVTIRGGSGTIILFWSTIG